jgi:hypothetical protein
MGAMVVCRGSLFLSLAVLLAGCIPSPDAPPKRPEAAKAALPNNPEILACMSDLARAGAHFSLLPDYYAGHCSATNAIKLVSIGIPITNLGATRCGTARIFAGWIHTPVQKAAREVFGKSVIQVETMGSYSCRNVKGTASNRLSEHAFANAVDVSGFILSDGRRITVETGWSGDEDAARFLRLIRDAACQRFSTVLSPDYNAAHYNHLHFDMAATKPYCR